MGIVIWELVYRTLTGRYIQPYSEFNLNYDFQIMVQAAEGLRPTIPKTAPKELKKLYEDCVFVRPGHASLFVQAMSDNTPL